MMEEGALSMNLIQHKVDQSYGRLVASNFGLTRCLEYKTDQYAINLYVICPVSVMPYWKSVGNQAFILAPT